MATGPGGPAEGAEALSRVWTNPEYKGKTSGDSPLYCSRDRVYGGSWESGLKGLIGKNTAPNYHMGRKVDWILCA